MTGETAAQFDFYEAKKRLSCLIDRVQCGEEIVISRAGIPVARMVPLEVPLATLIPEERYDCPATGQ
jgi:prevent-host-death family protein